MTDDPILPYSNPVPNSGWSGSDTSRDRAIERDSSGKTVTSQTKILTLVISSGYNGLTVAEARKVLPNDHHGTVSGTLSNLHKAGDIDRLKATRNKCKIYVAPSAVFGRPTEKQGYQRNKTDGS